MADNGKALPKKAGRPKIERPADPLLARVHEGNSSRMLPAFRSARSNEPSAAAISAASAMRRLELLDAEIKILNGRKSDVYQELRAQGYDNGQVLAVMKRRRLPAAVRQALEEKAAVYWEQLTAAFDVIDAGDAETEA